MPTQVHMSDFVRNPARIACHVGLPHPHYAATIRAETREYEVRAESFGICLPGTHRYQETGSSAKEPHH